MPLKKWEPLNDMYRFWRDFRFPSFDSKPGDEPTVDIYELAVDIYERDRKVVVEAGIPGINPADLEIEVEDSYLRIFGSKKDKKEKRKKHYYSKEIKRGSFERVVRLPCPVQKNKIKAEYESGVLRVFLPKAAKTKTSKVKVQIKDKKEKK